MRSFLIACGTVALLILLIFVRFRSRREEAVVLNYDDMIMLDAEALGEGDIGSAYKDKVLPALRRYVASPAEIVEEINPETSTYKVTSQGKTYVIYSPDMDTSKGQSWGNATFALFDIVNSQLQDSPYRFYGINGGNDLGGIFLTQAARDRAVKFLNRKTDWPYLPKPDYPWYGQPHDD